MQIITADEKTSKSANTAAQEVMADLGKPAEINGISMDGNAAVVTDTVVDVFKDPDVKSDRITQVIFNQPVSVLEQKGGWTKVISVDGSQGWVRSKFVDKNVSSIYGKVVNYKIVVTSKDKSVYSNVSGGITLKDVVMGTELYAFNSLEDAYEVYLPDNKTGWLRESGIIQISLNSKVPYTTKEDFVSSVLKFKGTSYLWNGLSSMGIDSQGLVYICARINGIDLPRSIEGQMKFGREVKLEEAREGDLIFFTSDGDIKTFSCVGICIGGGKAIYAGSSTGYVTNRKSE